MNPPPLGRRRHYRDDTDREDGDQGKGGRDGGRASAGAAGSALRLGRPDYFLDADRLGDDFRYRGLNPMKGGVVYADFVTTVSPSHADEALYDDGAPGLGRTLKEHAGKFRGVLNGVDYHK